MRLALVCVLLVGAGCLEPSLETCENLTCPANTECVIAGGGARCATPDQIESCAGLTDGAACTALTGGGVCRDGVCLVPTCGDGVVDPGEDCDDGNRDPGDGCGSTCRGERCGNGVTDFGEGCDCGDAAAAPRPECDGHHNSDTDELSPCRADCTLRRCGDGELDALEQCDGSVPSGITCESLGYHADAGNALACSPLCRFDVSACTGGICGDGAVNGAEACDGTAFASGLTCATFGFYDTSTAHLRCTSACTFDTALCQHRCNDGVVDPGEFCDPGSATPVRGYCTDYGYSTGPLTCSASCGPGFDQCRAPSVWTNVSAGGNYSELVAGEQDAAWALRATAIEHWTLAGTQTFTVAGGPRDLAAFGDTAAVSSFDGKVRLFDPTGLVMTITPPNPCSQLVMTAADTIVCLDSDSAAWWVNGTWQTPRPTGAGKPSDAIARADGSVLFSDWSGSAGPPTGSVHTIDITGAATTQVGQTTNIEHLDHRSDGYFGGVAYGGGTYGMDGNTYGYNLVAQATTGDWIRPAESRLAYSATEAGGLRMYGADPEFAVVGAGTTRRTTGPVDSTFVRCTRTVTFGAGALCLSFGSLWRFAGATVSQTLSMGAIAPGTLADAFIDELDTTYFVSTSGQTARLPPLGWAPPAGPVYTTILGRNHTAILLVGTTGGKRAALALWTGSAWATATTLDDITTAAVDDSGNVTASVRNTGSTTTCTLFTGPLTALVAGSQLECPTSMWYSPTGALWYATRSHLARLGGPSFDISANGAIGTPWITGLDDTHLYAAAGHTIYSGNGTTWTAQLVDAGSAFDWISVSAARGAIATSGIVTWALHAGAWTKLRLPTDPTPFIHPQLTPWGVVFKTPSGIAAYAAWEAGWP